MCSLGASPVLHHKAHGGPVEGGRGDDSGALLLLTCDADNWLPLGAAPAAATSRHRRRRPGKSKRRQVRATGVGHVNVRGGGHVLVCGLPGGAVIRTLSSPRFLLPAGLQAGR